MSRANLRMKGHVDMPSNSAKDLQESEALGSSPSHLPSWSPARRLLSSHPNMRHCLEIHVTLTEELGAVPPPSHSWMAPLVKAMLHDIRTSFTEAVVTGPHRAVLFNGRHSLGEGLTADKATDVTFLLTGAGIWVGKLAYITADPYDNSRRLMSHHPSHNRLLHEGKGAGTSMCKSASPTTLHV